MIMLHVTQAYDGGGVSRVIVNLAKAFSKLGHYNIVVAPKCSKEYVSAFNECIEVPQLMLLKPFNSYLYGFLVSQSLLETLEKLPYSPDGIIVHPGWYAALVRSLVKRYSNTAIVTVCHGTYSNELRFMKYHPITGYDRVKYMMGIMLSHKNEMKILKDTSSLSDEIAIVAVSRRTREELVSNGVRASSVHAILNGVDKDLFKPIDRTEAEEVLERKYGVKVKGFTIAHIGLGAIKGTHILIKALAMLKKRGVKFTALLAGKVGPPSYKQYLNELIRRSGLLENVKLLGRIREEDVPYLYNAADVTVVPSYSEGSPLVIPESLACGTPVIATDVGGNSEYLGVVNLRELLVNITVYDFSIEITKKINYYIQFLDNIRKKTGKYISCVPSWKEVAEDYMRILKIVKL